MKLLVLAQAPPPLHGQSLMVQALVAGLPAHGIAVHHVNLRLSRDATDIGRWRPGKIWGALVGAFGAIAARFRHGCDTLYYVPAPGKRGALYRDWLVLLLCRPFFPRLVLHWHATGLAAWLDAHATPPERAVTRWLLGRADLSIVLAHALQADAGYFRSRRIAVVPNGIADPLAAAPAARTRGDPFQVLYLGLCSEEKGVFAAAEAVIEANRRHTSGRGKPAFALKVAGPFPSRATAERFALVAKAHPDSLQYCGPVAGGAKHALLTGSDCLCLPTQYPHEGQPLVLLEALAYDLPIIATRWRGIPETLPPASHLVEPGDTPALVNALDDLLASPRPANAARSFFLERYTLERHLTGLADALDPQARTDAAPTASVGKQTPTAEGR